MKTIQLTGKLIHPIYSPKGGIEGMLIKATGKTVQVVFPPHPGDLLGPDAKEGTALTLTVSEASAGPGHPVHQLIELLKIGGKPPGGSAPGKVTVSKGKVARLNYARHGEPNGVMLDTGDFIHTRPDNMKILALKRGDAVTAQGEAAPLANGARVIEAVQVNGVKLAKKTAKKAAKKATKKAAKKAAKTAPEKASR